jgi:formamidopyrimidine-DNA glycosylase
MPELPEVEVVKLFLEAKLLHQTITKLEILTAKSFIGDPKDILNQKITKFSRVGKQLSIYLSNGKILLVHLKMTGQLVIGDFVLGHPTKNATKDLPNKSTRLIFHFKNTSLRGAKATKQSVLYFNDQRKFGWVKVFDPPDLTVFQSNLGLDIFNPKFTPQYLFNQLHKTSRPVKSTLLDQHFFAGIGNIYANDALFLAKVHPQTISKDITLPQARKIHRYLIDIMQQSVLSGGSTARDKKYIRPDGTPGQNQFSFRVYQRAGEPCPKCGTPIKRISLGGRGTFFCPKCQKL